MATALNQSQKMYLVTAGVLAFGVAAYGLGRVYPPLGPSAGTIAPAQRYQASQVGEADVTLGDTSIPELMQTDAFEMMIKDPSFRALVTDPGFGAIAGNSQALAALRPMPNRSPSWRTIRHSCRRRRKAPRQSPRPRRNRRRPMRRRST